MLAFLLNAACCWDDTGKQLLTESSILVFHLPSKEQWFHATIYYTREPSRLNQRLTATKD